MKEIRQKVYLKASENSLVLVFDYARSIFSHPYNRRIADQHGYFTTEDYRKWLKKAERNDLARALRRLAQLNQSKVYLFWKRG